MSTPEGLVPGPVVDDIQTYFGERGDVPADWEVRMWTDTPWRPVGNYNDKATVMQCRPRSRTESIPWHEAVGRIAITPADKYQARVVRVEHRDDGALPWVWTDPAGPGNGGGIGFPSRDGTIEVLIEDDR